jgi:F-type H+-transporting ATPase subunit alpha
MEKQESELIHIIDQTFGAFERVRDAHHPALVRREVGKVIFAGNGIARVTGLPYVKADELVRFSTGDLGMTFNLDADEVGVILLGDARNLRAGDEVYRTERIFDIPVGDALLGRVIDAVGQPLDGDAPPKTTHRSPIERPAPSIMQRKPVDIPLQTGIKVIDALFPIGKGQRELILGDRQTGKTAIALDTIINQADKDVICVYCGIGQRNAAIARLIADLRQHNAMPYCVIMVSSGETAAGLQFIAPYAATSIAEYFMEQGRDVLIVYDDLTQHARAYRELSLLLRRPPGREAYPGDIFYIHARLLERSTALRPESGAGSLTALPIVETQAQNLSAYIPTNLISITDGQIYLSPDQFQRGVLPAVDIGRSVSRVGGAAQFRAYRAVAGDLRLSYAQFEELEIFSRFGTRLDAETQRTIEHGRRVREIFKQQQYEPLPVLEQIAVMLAVGENIFDEQPPELISRIEASLRKAVRQELKQLGEKILDNQPLDDADREAILALARRITSALSDQKEKAVNGDHGNTAAQD